MSNTIILGAGMTGLAAGMVSGIPIYEAMNIPGGICSSYYMKPGYSQRKYPDAISPNELSRCYRFELGGGHWIFGADTFIQRFIGSLVHLQTYTRNSAVYLPREHLFIPYPIQNHLQYLPTSLITRTLQEIITRQIQPSSVSTMAEWLEQSFGPTLGEIFFYPFHELYTAGLWKKIAPQDTYKSPIDLKLVIQGSFQQPQPVGYNSTFLYPEEGLDGLARKMAQRCNIHYNKKVVNIDVAKKSVSFEDGTSSYYENIIATLPLHRLIELTHIPISIPPDPSPNVLVVNIGAKRTNQTPSQQWLYVPYSHCGIHRVGFYSSVSNNFLPSEHRLTKEVASIYVEKAYPQDTLLSLEEMDNISKKIIRELQEWSWIGDVEVYDPTWISSAYTWSWPNSTWKIKAQSLLQQNNIFPVGRYARWTFQGIADSIRDGLIAGSCFRSVNG